MLDKETIFANQNESVKYAVVYYEDYKENSVTDDGKIKHHSECKTYSGYNINFYTNKEDALKDVEILPKITNKKYYNITLYIR